MTNTSWFKNLSLQNLKSRKAGYLRPFCVNSDFFIQGQRQKIQQYLTKYTFWYIFVSSINNHIMTKAERTKKFIIEQAAPIYNEKGVAGTNVDDVLDATKLTKGAIYSHFKNKDDLSMQVTDYLLDRKSVV